MMNDIEMLKRRYVQALETLIDGQSVQRRWIPAVAIGDDGGALLKAAFSAAKSVGRSMVVLQLTVDDQHVVQHRIHAARMDGRNELLPVSWTPR